MTTDVIRQWQIFSRVTNHLGMPNICSNYFKVLPCIRDLQSGHEKLRITNQATSAISTFEIGIAVLWHDTPSLISQTFLSSYMEIHSCSTGVWTGHTKKT